MSGQALVIAELAITLGVVVGWGVWELHKLKKDK
jgi:predicted negative regulator of RcsB-dependent stress response